MDPPQPADPLNPWALSKKKKKKTPAITAHFTKKTDAQVIKFERSWKIESVDHMFPALELNGRHVQDSLEWDFKDQTSDINEKNKHK